MTIYVTKYALTRGVIPVEVSGDNPPSIVYIPSIPNGYATSEEWEYTDHVAQFKVQQERERKIRKLESQIKKLRLAT